MNHDLELHLQIWNELKPHLAGGDIESAADDFIHVLIEHGIDANEIITYALDTELKAALREHVDEEEILDEEDHDDWDDELYHDIDGC